MADWNLPIEGGCRCGRVRIRISEAPLLTSVCHCTGCQHMTASAFSTSIGVPSGGFAVIAGTPEIGGVHGDAVHHHHCGWCKSWLFTRLIPEPGFVNVRATMLDDPQWFVPFVEFWTREKLPWATTPATHSFASQPGMDAFPPLLAEFAGRTDLTNQSSARTITSTSSVSPPSPSRDPATGAAP